MVILKKSRSTRRSPTAKESSSSTATAAAPRTNTPPVVEEERRDDNSGRSNHGAAATSSPRASPAREVISSSKMTEPTATAVANERVAVSPPAAAGSNRKKKRAEKKPPTSAAAAVDSSDPKDNAAVKTAAFAAAGQGGKSGGGKLRRRVVMMPKGGNGSNNNKGKSSVTKKVTVAERSKGSIGTGTTAKTNKTAKTAGTERTRKASNQRKQRTAAADTSANGKKQSAIKALLKDEERKQSLTSDKDRKDQLYRTDSGTSYESSDGDGEESYYSSDDDGSEDYTACSDSEYSEDYTANSASSGRVFGRTTTTTTTAADEDTLTSECVGTLHSRSTYGTYEDRSFVSSAASSSANGGGEKSNRTGASRGRKGLGGRIGKSLKNLARKANRKDDRDDKVEEEEAATAKGSDAATGGSEVADCADATTHASPDLVAEVNPISSGGSGGSGASITALIAEDEETALSEEREDEEGECCAEDDDDDDDSARCYTVGTTHTVMTDFMKMEALTSENMNHQLSVLVQEHGDVNKLMMQISYVPIPRKPTDVVIKIDCSTITLQDCMIRRGEWYDMQPLPFTPGTDFVGVIQDMGYEASKKSTFRVGDKVAAVIPSGGNAKYITMPYDKIIKVPDDVDPIVALCMSSVYVPARQAIDAARRLNMPFTGANFLIVGGNSPNGLAAIELAILEGANVYATADECHHPVLRGLGARCFPISPEKWLPSLGGKMDVVLDSVCLDDYESSRAALAPNGTLVCRGMSAVYTQGPIMVYGRWDVRDYKAMQCRMKAQYLMSNTVYYDRMERYNQDLNEHAQHFRYLCHLEAKHGITPMVSTRSPLSLVAKAQTAIEYGETGYGVCVCTPWITSADMIKNNGEKLGDGSE